MSDRIAVMHEGRFEQVGTPAEVYDRPRTSFVARFVGTANIVKGQVAENREGVLTVRAAGGPVSYTHLDVYKRQSSASASSPTNWRHMVYTSLSYWPISTVNSCCVIVPRRALAPSPHAPPCGRGRFICVRGVAQGRCPCGGRPALFRPAPM